MTIRPASTALFGRLLAGTALLFACGVSEGAQPAPSRPTWRDKVDARLLAAPPRVAQDVLVVLGDQADLSAARSLGSKLEKGRFVFERLSETARRSQKGLLGELAARGVAARPFWIANMISVRGDSRLLRDLAARDDVRRVEANPPMPTRLPLPAREDALRRPTTTEWNLDMVGAPQVWAQGFTGQGAVVAGADTGIAWRHPALKAKYRGWNGSTANHSYNWHDAVHDAAPGNPCGSDSSSPCDDDDHGTQTMGIMVGDDGAGNQIGMAPGARWIGCRNMDQGTGTPARYTECFQWFVAPTDSQDANPDPSKAPDAIGNSWDCPKSEGCTTPDILKTVVANVRAAGIVVAVAEGNEGPDCGTMDVPAIYDAVISVGSTGETDAISDFSSRGPGETPGRPKPEVLAPGVNVRSSLQAGGYGTITGTSASTPHVAGLTALLLSAAPALAGNVDEIEAIIEGTAVPKTTDQTCGGFDPGATPNDAGGWGRIDAVAAVAAARCPQAPPVITVANTVAPGAGGIPASVAAVAGHGYVWAISEGTITAGQGTSAITFTSGLPGSTTLRVSDSFGGCDSPPGTAVIAVDFLDVPPAYLFHDAVVSIARGRISNGCGGGAYCPNTTVTRDQMAAFLLRGEHGGSYQPPPASGTVFTDVGANTFLAAWIEQLAAEKITSGCGISLYCPDGTVNRAALAKFLLLAKNGSAYQPPPATGTVFADVPASAFLADWIEQLFREGITSGCGGGNFCPDGVVGRGEMAAFLKRTFGLP